MNHSRLTYEMKSKAARKTKTAKPATLKAKAKSAPALRGIKSILVPIDFSAPSQKALAYAVPFARQFGAKLTVMNVVEPIASTLRALVERERARALVAYDPNIRLNVEPRLARWHEQLDWMLPRCHLLKISDEDLALLSPGQSPAAFAASALSRGTQAVIVTRGALGALAWTAKTEAAVIGVPVSVVDTVGAGDTFQAALLTWFAEHNALHPVGLAALTGDDWQAALGFAARAAAITCSRRGADMPRRHELT